MREVEPPSRVYRIGLVWGMNSALFHFSLRQFSAFAGKGRLDKDERRHIRITLLIAHGLELFNYPVTGFWSGEGSRSRVLEPLCSSQSSLAEQLPAHAEARCRSDVYQKMLQFLRF